MFASQCLHWYSRSRRRGNDWRNHASRRSTADRRLKKAQCATRCGIKTVIIQENERDLAEVPDNIKENLIIKPVKWIDEVPVALESQPEPLSDEAYLATSGSTGACFDGRKGKF